MLSHSAITYVLLPLIIGSIVISTCLFLPKLRHMAGLGTALGLIAIYILGEGNIVFPPIAAKHKIVFLIPLIGFVSPFLTDRRAGIIGLTVLTFLAAGFGWIVFRKYTQSPPNTLDIVLAISVFCTAFLITIQAKKRPTIRFQLSVSLQISLIAGAATALAGGFLGVGLLLGSMAAFWGGAMLTIYASILSGYGASKTHPVLLSASTAVISAFSIVFLMLGSYATNLSQLAFLLCLITLCVPIVSGNFVSKFSEKIQPLIASAFAGVPAILAIYFAMRHF